MSNSVWVSIELEFFKLRASELGSFAHKNDKVLSYRKFLETCGSNKDLDGTVGTPLVTYFFLSKIVSLRESSLIIDG